MSIKVEGVREAEAAIDQKASAIAAALAVVVEAVAEAVKEEARRQVPVDTGRLRDAIEYRVDGNTAEVFVSTPDARYGHFVEFGTSRRPEKPFMGPAAETERTKIAKRVERAVKDAANG